MKTAILLSGFVRNYKKTWKNFEKYIREPLNADVFFSGYHNNLYDSDEKDFASLYKPKVYKFYYYTDELKQKIITKSNIKKFNKIKREGNKPGPEAVMSMWYQITKCFNLCQPIYKSYYDYDLIIRTRPDLYFYDYISKTQIEEALKGSRVLTATEWDFGGYSDQFAIGTARSMSFYCSMFDNLNQYNESNCVFHAEQLLKYHLNYCNIQRIGITGKWCYDFLNPNGEDFERYNASSLSRQLVDTNKL